MQTKLLKFQLTMFLVMTLVGVFFNPMNILAYRFDDLYLSLTLFYGGILMAANMMWSHEIVHILSVGHFNIKIFIIGIVLSTIISIICLREQLCVTDEQWLRRMISHHSTALTTSQHRYKRTQSPKIKELTKQIILTQEREIELMKAMI